jgi:membrane-associated phospholipid phosphatase
MKARTAITVCLLSVLLAFLVVGEVLGLFSGLDSIVYSSLCCKWFLVSYFISLSGSSVAFLIYVALFLVYDLLWWKKVSFWATSFLMALIFTMIAVFLMKVIFQVPRPGEGVIQYPPLVALLHFDSYSFPSGHAARASVLAYYFCRKGGKYVKVLAWVWALSVAVSRLLLGVHWFSDVVTSIVLGLLISILTDLTSKKWVRLYNRIIGRVEALRIEPVN